MSRIINKIVLVGSSIVLCSLLSLPVFAAGDASNPELNQAILNNIGQQHAAAETSSTAGQGGDSGALQDMMYKVCYDNMLKGMKEKLTEKELSDTKTMEEMNNFASSVCKCAAPRFTKVVMQSMENKTQQDDKATQAMFETEAQKAIMGCMKEQGIDTSK